MKKSLRQSEIYLLVKENQTCTIVELAKKLNVSGETIRRNVKKLVDEGLVMKVHGGITLPFLESEPTLHKRMTSQIEEKKAIAKLVAQLIEDGDSVIIASSSTATFVAQALIHHKNLTIITNSPYIASQLAQSGRNRIFLAGGELAAHNASSYGPTALDFIRQFNTKKAILSVSALHAKKGCMDHQLSEAELYKTIIKRAEKVIIATDSTKFGRTSPMKICNLSKIDILVTDKLPDKKLLQQLERSNVQTIAACTEVDDDQSNLTLVNAGS